MEVTVYRKHDSMDALSTLDTCSDKGLHERPIEEASPTVQRDLQPDMFYPRITEKEWEVWGHWLPTTLTFDCQLWRFPADVLHTLKRLAAPQEVLEEFQWATTMELFDTYEIRTPERHDLRDPLLVGRVGSQRYRLALWGESLRPLDEITRLVERSLVLRYQAAAWRRWAVIGGTLGGLAFGLWTGSRTTMEGDPFAAAFVFGLLGLFLTIVPLLAMTPENRQQNFLDRYRR